MAKKKHKGLEYRVLVTPTFDETLKKAGTLFLIETVKQFSNFNYEVVVEDHRLNETTIWSLHGLRTPELSMPSVGAAQFRKIYFDVKGKHNFILRKADGEENLFTMKISPSSVSILIQPEHLFASIYTSNEEFERNREQELDRPVHKPDVKRLTLHTVTKKK
ncbi:MAG: hypothetical protein KGJ59_07165 [Bacteroidota bacterium]|nr:hypothetical protein [Bacteroidota bacterium]